MPMPAPNSEWPPKEYATAFETIRQDDAQLSGRLDVINKRRSRQNKTPYRHRSQLNGGLVGTASRFMLGKPQPERPKSHLITHHLPIAEQLTTALADFMAGKPPSAALDPKDAGNTKAEEALDRLVSSDKFSSDWWNAVYRAGSLGWVYGRVVWNQAVQPDPWIEWVDADGGMAEFENGRQCAVTFWDVFPADKGKDVYRLLQRHTPGQIEYGLYKGTEDNIGMPVPFTEHPKAAHIAELDGLVEGTTILTGTEGITANMLSNYRPRQEWRHQPLLRYYSVSDVSRGGTLFENIDHNWSQLQHEVEAARGRLFIDEALLNSDGPGKGSYFDWFRDIYEAAPGLDADSKPTFEQIQFDMRVAEYLQLVDASTRKAVSALGLSPFTVDMDPQASGQMTATETKARTKRTRSTAETKGRHERAHLSSLLTAWLQMDADLNGYTAPQHPVIVSLPDQIEVSEEEIAANVSSVYSNGLSSLVRAVAKLHPEWTPEEITREVELIKQERREEAPADPFAGLGLDEDPARGDE